MVSFDIILGAEINVALELTSWGAVSSNDLKRMTVAHRPGV